MKTLFLNLLLQFSTLFMFAGGVEFSSGMHQNIFKGAKNIKGYHNGEGFYNGTNFTCALGYSFNYNKNNFSPLIANIRFDNIKGSYYKYWSGRSYGTNINSNINKNILGIEVFPLNFKILKSIKLNLGAEYAMLVKDNTKSINHSSGMGINGPGYNETTVGDYLITDKNYFGLTGRLCYDIKLNKGWGISPLFRYYYGLSGEYSSTDFTIISKRYGIEIAVSKSLKKSKK